MANVPEGTPAGITSGGNELRSVDEGGGKANGNGSLGEREGRGRKSRTWEDP